MRTKRFFGTAIAAPTAVAMAFATFAPLAQARDLVADFASAMRHDPSYLRSLAEYEVGHRNVKVAKSAFYPEATYSNQRMVTDSGVRSTLTVTQPVLNFERLLILDQADAQELLEQVNLLTKRQDLANRLVKAANAVTLAMESISLNQAKLDALVQQAERSKRLRTGGLGTVTDERDVEVKLSQARAQQVTFQANLSNAIKNYQAITGQPVTGQDFVLPNQQGQSQLAALEQLIQQALQLGPKVLSARYALTIAEFEAKKIKASFLPNVSAVYQYTAAGSTSNSYNYVGVNFSVPLKMGTIYGLDAAKASVVKAQEALREAESQVRLDVDRLRASVSSGAEAIRIQKDAIAAAELSVEANTKSYQGGVRTSVDVLNAIQTLFQVKADYVNLVATQAENILSLKILAATNPIDAVTDAYKYLYTAK